jgi:prepilin-type N-terminal cleavage/methylation domain-containing protein
MNWFDGNHATSRGFSLTELIVVMAIITTLLGAATLGYHEWQVKYNVEAQVRTMVTDFSELRVRAMTRKQRHSITVNKQNYIFKSYSSDDEPLAAGTVMPPSTRAVNYALKSDSTTFYSGQVFEIDHRGTVVGIAGTIYLDSNSSAWVDCLKIHTVRTNPGKKNAAWSSCDDR